MIKKLQRKFVLIAVISLFVTEAVIIGAMNAINIYQLEKKSDNMLKILSHNDGAFPDDNRKPDNNNFEPRPKQDDHPPVDMEGMNAETKYITRYFTVRTDNSGKTTSIDTGHIAAVTSDTAVEYLEAAAESGKTSGRYGNYKFLVTDTDEGKLYIFLDYSQQLETRNQFIIISCSIGFAGLAVVSMLIMIFSKRAIRPTIESMEKQKRFITDAGHEIKTPLAIISANTEVLELTSGESEWTESIKNQTKRLAELIKNLLTLSKMDEQLKTVFEKFNISDAVFDAASPFKTLAQTRGKSLDICIENDITFFGDEGMIRQLVSILLDNAVKYADDGSEIALSLKKEQRSIRIAVYNPCTQIPDKELDKLFDRFYRADSSRSRETGGYGIGLSIAKAITDSHGGKISAKSEKNGIVFEALLPIKNEQKKHKKYKEK